MELVLPSVKRVRTLRAPWAHLADRLCHHEHWSRHVRTAIVLAVVTVAAVVPMGCSGHRSAAPSGNSSAESNAAGDIPDNQAFVAYTDLGGVYVVSVPEGWSRSTDGTETVFTDKLNSIRMETVPRPTAPTPDSVRAEELPQLAASTPGFNLNTVTTGQYKAGAAVLIIYTARSALNPVTGKRGTDEVQRYEFWNSGREAKLTLTSPQGADNADPWRTVVDSFQWR